MTWSLVWIFDALFSGSSSTRPSRLPKMLWPTQLRIFQLRRANMGARTVLSRVSPVLPSLPHVLGPGVELRQARLNEASVKDVGSLVQFVHGLAVTGTANVMAADHEP